MIELLSPAQNKECAISAINFGADAVYMGAPKFGARKNAPNSLEDIKEVVNYAHKFYAKVYITINTILTDEEILQARELIYKLYDIGVDAIIIQDMGLLELELPSIQLFASTQCDNRNLEKVKFLEETGFDRVILARELSLKQIEEICQNTNIPVETFIHGALCVSYSGQCYMSFVQGGRSANRGECAQPCRKKYSLIDEKGKYIAKNQHLLCLKDFNASKHIENLVKAGVTSFKIEGRLKDENYVKNITLFYRNLLDKFSEKTSSGVVFGDFEPNPAKSFNRKVTDYFLEKRTDIFNFSSPKSWGEYIGKVQTVGEKYFEIDTDITLSPQDGLCFLENNELSGFLINKIDGNKIYPNKMPKILKGTEIFRNFDFSFEKILKNSKTKRRIKVEFELKDNLLIAKDEDNNIVSLKFEYSEAAKNQNMKDKIISQLKKTGETDFYTENVFINSKELPFLPISKINELRRQILDLLIKERIKNYKRETPKAKKVVPFILKEGDYRLNVHNDFAKQFYEKRGCDIEEYSLEKTKKINDKIIMQTKHCLKYAFNLCGQNKHLFLIDETSNKKYKLEFDCKNCQMIIRNINDFSTNSSGGSFF